MAPITRSSVQGRPAQNQFGDFQRNNSTQDHLESDHASDEEMADDDVAESIQEEPGSPFRSTAQEFLRPLQDTADRVSRQVEEFAKALDKFVANREPTDASLWEDALVLLDRYSKIAQTRKTNTTSTDDADSQTQKLQLESDLWGLIRNLLYCNSPETVNNTQIAQESRLAGLHRYSNNVELWTAFLDSDVVAQEYECILGWLQDRAADTLPPIETIMKTLQEKSERGDGVWSAGPIFTQSAIKKQKRTRALSRPLDPSNPNISRSHTRKADGKPLVAQLDPDSRTRESALLEEQDEYYERAAWQTCWEMLRRGLSAAEIHSWWAERKEAWRYAVIRGSGLNTEEMAQSPWLRILNLASNAEWLERCHILAQNPNIHDVYQKAVYGLLCGDTGASKAATKTIDDHLFVLFNALLIQRYLHYVHAYRDKLNDQGAIVYRPQPGATARIRHYATMAQADPTTKDEIHLPHKLLELAVVSKDFDTFFVSMGQAAADVAHASGQGKHLMRLKEIENQNDSQEIARVNAQDQDAVRMVVHLQLLLRALGFLESSYADHEYEMENNIASYIGWLEREGKFSLIPLYASKMSKPRTQQTLGEILINVTDRRERDLQVKLMKQYGIDVSDVAYGIFSIANFDLIQRLRNLAEINPPRITVPGGTSNTAQLRLRAGLMTGEVSDEAERAIRSVEWYRYVDAENWGVAAWSVALLYKTFLIDGNFVALRQLYERAGLSELSLAAVGMNLIFADEEPPPEEDQGENEEMDDDHVRPISPTRKQKSPMREHPLTRAGTDRGTLAYKSLVWRELEQLVGALDSLDVFQEIADNLEANRSNAHIVRECKREMKKALEDVRENMQPLFDPDFLCRPQDEMEAVMLTALRNHYVPECILAYNGVLFAAGHYCSRVWLVECMELAQVVAQNPMLTEAFVESGRMKELVKAFALDSRSLLEATEQGASKSKKIKTEKGNSDIWKVTWKQSGPVDLEALD
ncbi:Nucleoporin NUP84 [Exophiala dermatitidis]